MPGLSESLRFFASVVSSSFSSELSSSILFFLSTNLMAVMPWRNSCDQFSTLDVSGEVSLDSEVDSSIKILIVQIK